MTNRIQSRESEERITMTAQRFTAAEVEIPAGFSFTASEFFEFLLDNSRGLVLPKFEFASTGDIDDPSACVVVSAERAHEYVTIKNRTGLCAVCLERRDFPSHTS